MSDQGFAGNPGGNSHTNGSGDGADPQAPRVQVVAQFVRDLSFENPGAPGNAPGRPQIDFGVDLQAKRLEGEHYEVELKLRVSAKVEEKPMFLLELVYAGLFLIQNVPEDVIQRVLLMDGPQLLFPFARRIVADAVRDGGMPPLMIEPIDFAGLYRAKQLELQQQQDAGQTPII
jgi:preprotein translocase subunit SecB